MMTHLSHTATEDHIQHVAAAIRGTLSHHHEELSFIPQYPGLPDTSSNRYRQDLISYSSTDQWKRLVEDVVSGWHHLAALGVTLSL